MIHYLHDSIIYDTDNNTLICTNNTKKNKITLNNWHKYLDIIGWNKLPLRFIRFLNRNSKNRYKNSPYGVIDCGGDGECLFHCISHALSSELTEYFDYDYEDTFNRDLDKINEILDTLNKKSVT